MTDTSKDWMMMPSGKQVFPLHVKLEDLDINDMAHNLGQICRYNGGVDDFYSVAEHSILISRALQKTGHSPLTCLQGLLHDGPEYIIGDMIRPLKNALAREVPAAAAFLKAVDHDIEQKIATKYQLGDFHPDVKEFDDRIVNDEKSFLFGSGRLWTHGGVPLYVDIQCYDPSEAKRQFRFRFRELWRALGREEQGVMWE
jgi:hypothetical protein